MSAMMTQRQVVQTPAATPARGALFSELERVLIELTEIHQRMLGTVQEHRGAISRADLSGIAGAVARQGEMARAVASIEERRAAVVSALVGGAGRDQVRMSQVIATAPEAFRERLSGLASVLRDVLTRLHQEQQALKLAGEALAVHMEGVMRQVYQRVSHAGTYVRSGKVDTAVQVVSSLDVRT